MTFLDKVLKLPCKMFLGGIVRTMICARVGKGGIENCEIAGLICIFEKDEWNE